MTDLFPAACAIILDEEGVFSDDKNDPGGATVYGIARASHPDIPWPPTKDAAVALYRQEYWDAHRCGEMPWAWALAVFDSVVNQDTTLIRVAQLALRTNEDGAVGPETITAMARAPADDFRAFLALRIEKYIKSPKFPVFGLGWIKRVVRIAQAAEHEPV